MVAESRKFLLRWLLRALGQKEVDLKPWSPRAVDQGQRNYAVRDACTGISNVGAGKWSIIGEYFPIYVRMHAEGP